MGLRQLGHAQFLFAKSDQHIAPGAVGQRGKYAIEVDGFLWSQILNH